jgi:hypothetical protein
MVVQVTAVAERPVRSARSRRDFLGRRLARRPVMATRRAPLFRRIARPIRCSASVVSGTSTTIGSGSPARRHPRGRPPCSRPAIEGVADKGVTVVALAGDGDEQLAATIARVSMPNTRTARPRRR